MPSDWGKLFLLLAAIGLILLAASGKGQAIWATLRGGTPAPKQTQNFDRPNPTDASGGMMA